MHDYIFSEQQNASGFIRSGDGVEFLPEREGLYGITLRPYQTHYHNFIYGSYMDTSGSIQTKTKEDEQGIVKDHLDTAAGTANSIFLKFFGWKIIKSFYKEVDSSNNEIALPLRFDEYSAENRNATSALDPAERDRRSGAAKWSYKSIDLDGEDGPSKIVPFQMQLTGTLNGPSGIGVHWGIEKRVNLPMRIGAYFDFYLNKDVDFPTKSSSATTMPTINSVMYDNIFGMNAGGSWQNSSCFVGPRAAENNFFNLSGKSYIMIEIRGDIASGDWYFLVIRNDSNPRLYRVRILSNSGNTLNAGGVDLLGEYIPGSGRSAGVSAGLRMLQGDKNGHLRLMVRNLYGYIIIENNVFEDPWVISIPAFEPSRSTTLNQAPSRTSGTFHLANFGGKCRIFGGNMSCGVSYSPVQYINSGSMQLSELKLYGVDRVMGTYMNTFGAREMPRSIKTGSRFYANSANLITDANGTVDLGNRPDVVTGASGQIFYKSEIEAVDSATNSGMHRKLNTVIKFSAGAVKVTSGTDSYLMENVTTPVLQYARQVADKKNLHPTRNPVRIQDIVETIEITKQAEEYHVVRVSGSIDINVHSPSANRTARDRVLAHLGSARYVSINLEHFCDNLNVGSGQLFTGIAFNPSLQEQAGRRFIRYDLKDYWTILESKLMFNSPYFDGALDTDVVRYLMEYSGIRDSYVSIHSRSTDAMPISFSFASPLAKFEDGRPVSDNIKELAKKYSKYAYFDESGVFKYKRIPAVLIPGSVSGSVVYTPIFEFFSTHSPGNINVTPVGPGQPVTASGGLSGDPQIAYEVKTTQWSTEGVFNKLLLSSVDARDKGIILVADTNYDSLNNPTSQGYLGYEKTFVQQEAAFGSMERVRKIARYYSRMYRPIYTISWKTIGGNNGVDIFDLVSVDGRMVVVQRISHQIDAKRNYWMTEWSGEWIWPPLTNFNPEI